MTTSLTFVIEAIDSVDTRVLVVAAEYEKVLGVLDLVREEKADSLERLLATVDVVAEEEIVRLGGEATIFKKSEEIIILAVDVTCGEGVPFTRLASGV
jgi:hypothetical protein